VACGGAGEPHPDRAPYDSTLEGTGLEAEATGEVVENSSESQDSPCEEGDWHECRVQLPKQGDVENCFVGVRVCENGVWSACQ
jgi:hypothetical protein